MIVCFLVSYTSAWNGLICYRHEPRQITLSEPRTALSVASALHTEQPISTKDRSSQFVAA